MFLKTKYNLNNIFLQQFWQNMNYNQIGRLMVVIDMTI